VNPVVTLAIISALTPCTSASAAGKTSAPAVAEASAQTSARASNTVLMAPESSPVDGLEESRVIHYSTLQAFTAAVRQLKNNLDHGRTRNQYLIVRDVDKDIMKQIEDREYKGVRYEWHGDLELLIVKVPTRAHETAAGVFIREITVVAALMGVPLIESQPLGAGKCTAPGGSPSKEPDWSMINANIRPNPDDFPAIVIEVGFSESLRKLRNDARLWFSMSNNDVEIVILIAVRAANNQVIIEKWTVGPLPAGRRRNRHTPSQLPRAEQEITITRTPPNTFAITSGAAPLILEFNRLFLRPPVGGEHDIVYTQAQLVDIAAAIFRMV